MKPPRWLWRGAALLAAAFAALAAGLPFVRVSWLAEPYRRSLEEALARKIEFSEVRCSLFPAPSLVAYQAVISEDPVFGLEPLAYADELRASLRLPALLAGRLEPASMRLTGASLNLVRSGSAGFNLASFLQKFGKNARQFGRIPQISLRQSRINFREGVLKSAYYLNAVDLDLEPPSSPGSGFQWRYEASPARTDRAEQGFGRFSGSGRWMPGPDGGRFALDVSLESSPISELLLFVAGRDLGLQGRFSARAFLDGPPHDLRVRGSLQLEQFDRPGFFGLRGGSFQLPLAGRLDLERQSLLVESAAPEKAGPVLPLSVHLAGSGILSAPRWSASLGFDKLPAEALLDICRRLGLETPAKLRVDAFVSGSAMFSTNEPARGEIHADSATLRFGDSAPFQATDASLRLSGDQLLLEHAQLATAAGAQVELSGSWEIPTRRLQFELRSQSMQLAEFSAALASLPGLEPPPWLASCTSGSWRGRIQFARQYPIAEQAPPGQWAGEAVLGATRCMPSWFPAPVAVDKAEIRMEGSAWRLNLAEGRFGESIFAASARFVAPRGAPAELQIRASRLEGADLDRIFRAALPHPASLLERTLRRRPAPPAWLRGLHVTGKIYADRLHVGRQELQDVQSRFSWRGSRLRFNSIVARWRELALQGEAEATLLAPAPQYRLRASLGGALAGMGWVDAEMEARAAELGPSMASSVQGWAEISAPVMNLPAGQARHLQVSVEYDGVRAAAPWRIAHAVFSMDGAFWTGHGQGSADGELRLEFTSPAGAVWEGRLWPPSAAPVAR